jgi:ribosome biogenesis GTPase A
LENGFAVNTEFNRSDDIIDVDHNARQMIQTRRAFYKELNKVVETADVILQILDARDPEGCRSHEIENMVRAGGKRLIQVLNKIDLVPP